MAGGSRGGNQCGIDELLLPTAPPYPRYHQYHQYHRHFHQGGNKHARTTIRCGAINLHRTLFTPKGSFCAQVLRMQSLVFLTYLKSSRLNRAQQASLCVLASPINYTASLNMSYTSLLDYDETPAYTESYVLLCNLETICATTITWTHHNLI